MSGFPNSQALRNSGLSSSNLFANNNVLNINTNRITSQTIASTFIQSVNASIANIKCNNINVDTTATVYGDLYVHGTIYPPGFTGYNGSTGSTGSTGSIGSTGYTGYTGSSGIPGVTINSFNTWTFGNGMTGTTGSAIDLVNSFTLTNSINGYCFTKQVYINTSTTYGLVNLIDNTYNLSIGYNVKNTNIANKKIDYGVQMVGSIVSGISKPSIWKITNGVTGAIGDIGYTGFLDNGQTGSVDIQLYYDGITGLTGYVNNIPVFNWSVPTTGYIIKISGETGTIYNVFYNPVGIQGSTGYTGYIGYTGYTGYTGTVIPNGISYGNYVFWNGSNWVGGSGSISLGNSAGIGQLINAIAIGNQAGYTGQNSYTIAIGNQAGYTGQKSNAIAIGNQAGYNMQGSNAIAIGNNAGYNNQSAGSIILNASGSNFISSGAGLFVKPVRNNFNNNNLLRYDPITSEITYAFKTFVIPHPISQSKYLVHGCLEGPEVGIYYRGKGTITNNLNTTIQLPNYVNYIGYNFTVQLTKIYTKINPNNYNYQSTEVENGLFTVYGPNGEFFWLIHAERHTIDTEPDKNDYNLCGDGPYTFLMPNK